MLAKWEAYASKNFFMWTHRSVGKLKSLQMVIPEIMKIKVLADLLDTANESFSFSSWWQFTMTVDDGYCPLADTKRRDCSRDVRPILFLSIFSIFCSFQNKNSQIHKLVLLLSGWRLLLGKPGPATVANCIRDKNLSKMSSSIFRIKQVTVSKLTNGLNHKSSIYHWYLFPIIIYHWWYC